MQQKLRMIRVKGESVEEDSKLGLHFTIKHSWARKIVIFEFRQKVENFIVFL